MKITLNIEKRFAYVIIGVLIVVLGFLVVNAYSSGSPASFVGHTWDEIVCDDNMCVDTSTGNVGIGTMNPSAQLSLLRHDVAARLDFKEINPNGGYAIDIVPLNTGDEDLYITRNGDRRVLIGNSATVLGDSTNGTVLIVQNGNVGIGIGTITPTQKLDVNGYVKGRSGLCIGNDCRTSWPSGGIIPCSLSGSFVMGACASCGWSCAKFGSVPVLNCDGTKVTSITLKTCCVECDHADPGGYGH